jgi:hypothetical protein
MAAGAYSSKVMVVSSSLIASGWLPGITVE